MVSFDNDVLFVTFLPDSCVAIQSQQKSSRREALRRHEIRGHPFAGMDPDSVTGLEDVFSLRKQAARKQSQGLADAAPTLQSGQSCLDLNLGLSAWAFLTCATDVEEHADYDAVSDSSVS
ncbi:MAG TPA: hypothetical protein VFH61_05195 [Thermoleophilia bacterium]|nr:hypothetical protein [Thermoleophilia bacterium]